MAIQNRRGADADFDASKMLPAELAITTDGSRKVYAAFAPGDVKELASKEDVQEIIDEFDASVAEDIQKATEEITKEAAEQKQAIEEKAEEILADVPNYEQRLAELEVYKANAILSKSTGETISITDAAPVPPLNIIPYGKSTQKQYEGYQLLDESTITVSSKGFYYHLNKPRFLKGGQSYTLKTYGYSINATMMTVYSNGEEYVSSYNKDTLVFTVNEDAEFTFRLYWTDPNDIPPIEDVRTQLNLGTEAKPYEPYTGGQASPSMAYPQPIVSAENVEVKVLSGNFFDISKAICYTPERIEQLGYGVLVEGNTLTVTTNSISGTGLSDSVGSTLRDFAPHLRVGETYTLSANSTANRKEIYLKEVKTFWKFGTPKEVTEEMLNSEVLFYTDTVAGGTTAIITDIMINIGETALPFEPYSEQSLTYQTPNGLHGIPLGTTIPDAIKNSPIHMSGVYWDNATSQYYIGNTKNENGKDVQRVWSGKPKKTIVFTSQNASYVSSVFDVGIFGVKFLDATVPSILTIAPWSKWGTSDKTTALVTYGIYYKDSSKTLEEINALFAELGTNFEVCGVLENPIITDTSEEELAQFNALRMNYTNTTIVNDAGAYTEVEYVCDTKEHIKQNYAPKSEIQEMKDQIAELQALMVNNS